MKQQCTPHTVCNQPYNAISTYATKHTSHTTSESKTKTKTHVSSWLSHTVYFIERWNSNALLASRRVRAFILRATVVPRSRPPTLPLRQRALSPATYTCKQTPELWLKLKSPSTSLYLFSSRGRKPVFLILICACS